MKNREGGEMVGRGDGQMIDGWIVDEVTGGWCRLFFFWE